MNQSNSKKERYILVIEKIITPIVSCCLLIVTCVYVYHTRNMAITMDRQFQLMSEQFKSSNRPYLYIDGIDWSYDSNSDLLYTIEIKNTGYIPAKYRLTSFYFENLQDEKPFYELSSEYFYSFPNDSDSSFSVFKPTIKRKITITPKEGVRLKEGVILKKGIKLKNNVDKLIEKINSKEGLLVVMKLNYWGIGDKNMTTPFVYEKTVHLTSKSTYLKKEILNTLTE